MIEDTLYYAGIGSRKTPQDILDYMRRIAQRLALRGFVLRSGAAAGADTAFEEGCVAEKGRAEIWLPWAGFNDHAPTEFTTTPAHEAIAATLHPAWERLSRGPRLLHTRNVGQILGVDANTPVSFVLCWTPDGCESDTTRSRLTGGTGTAIGLASRLGIPVFNLANPNAKDRLIRHVLATSRSFHLDGTTPHLDNKTVFVFGSNLAGRHGKGAALVAKTSFGAIAGKAVGLMGNSYGIPTKAQDLSVLSLTKIAAEVDAFVQYAKSKPEEKFFVTRIGCGLAGYSDATIAPLFVKAPSNCSFAQEWQPWLGVTTPKDAGTLALAQGINIFTGTLGLGGALTNMTVRSVEKGSIKHPYPVIIGNVTYPDAEAAYHALKALGHDAYNDGLMVDIIALKLQQHPKLLALVDQYGGEAWLQTCSHQTNAVSPRMQSWEGVGLQSRFIRNLIGGYKKAKTGRALKTRVVHVKEAPFDVYIGRATPDFSESKWHNPYHIGEAGDRDTVVQKYATYLSQNPELKAEVAELKGKTLGCWCKGRKTLSQLCHGDVLATLAEGAEWVPPTLPQSNLFFFKGFTMKVVGMLGLKAHGKDTAAEVLCQKGWERAAFADPLYAEVSQAFKVPVASLQHRETKELPTDQLALMYCWDSTFKNLMLALFSDQDVETVLTAPRSPRFILQHWGTEYRRDTCGDSYWRDQLKKQLLNRPDTNWVITDVRYPDEAEMLQNLGAECVLMRVVRPALLAHQDEGSLHKSEVVMRNYPVDVVVSNPEGQVQMFQRSVLNALNIN